MPLPERAQDLIQKYLDLAASESELAELEQMLAADAEVAIAFAEMARLHASLQGYFQKQYKMDQVAALLDATAAAKAPAVDQPTGTAAPATSGNSSIEQPLPRRTTFTPRYLGPVKPQRGIIARQLDAVVRHWKPVTVALLVLVIGTAVWIANNRSDDGLRLVSGRVTVAGRETRRIRANEEFEVANHEPAVIELLDGARIQLAAATRAAIVRDKDQIVVKLESGGGSFRVESGQPSFRVATRLGDVTTDAGKFSLDFITTLPEPVSPTAPMQVQLPRLVVAVAEGSVTVNRSGVMTTVAAGEERVFL